MRRRHHARRPIEYRAEILTVALDGVTGVETHPDANG
jgi:hypothetical protein